jgi:hypothetical protein
MSTTVSNNASDTQPPPNMNDSTDLHPTINDTFAGEYDTFNTSSREITTPESVQYTLFDSNSFDANQNPREF